jgi:hypothetical protein
MNTGSEKTTVICAVWHADPDRHALLSGHAASLLAQSRPIKVVYVFDKGDQPPAGLIGESICVSAPLTVYEAWNVALARCTTPYVMNLNLDDRLNGDAVEHLEQALDEDIRRMVVGGDWCVRYSQADTDATTRASPPVVRITSRTSVGVISSRAKH